MSEQDADAIPQDPIPARPQTPLFHAIESARYARQTQIRAIEDHTRRRLVAYIGGPGTFISAFDIPPFVDLLHDIPRGTPLDLMLQTPGGDVDQAERIILMCRKRVAGAPFRVIVPDSAKSAGTVIAVGADEIVMGEASELGPIDPQVEITTVSGEPMSRPAQSFLDGLNAIINDASEGDLSPAYFPLLDKLDPALIDFCRKALQRSERFAESFLRTYMLKDSPERAAAIAKDLNNVEKHLSHAAVIDADRASMMGLKVLALPHDDHLWQAYWRVYVDMRVALPEAHSRLFEGRKASLLV